jgi:hypothetical protein
MSEQPPEQPPEELQSLEVSITPEQMAGVYANFARVNHSPHEFTIDFVRIDYATAPEMKGILVARVGLSALFVRQLIDALEENWGSYAQKALPQEFQDDDARG